ncbi:hypothetical protein GCM10009006_01530 [Haloarcula argentinensis]|uniref:Sulfatase N-terminal domain-containing protein n=2 Tax=Haloarcula argentinensis TaxID=43776 RepID=A0A830FHH8_HALAR|nr:hypothetical protein GCM10009006_01530 [Haloarcula argentinensis]
MFNDQVQEKPEILSLDTHNTGFDAEGIWIELSAEAKPPMRMNRLQEEKKLQDTEAPFVHFVHDMGPHAPYGFENGVFESTKQFFKKHEKSQAELRNLYEENCRTSAERFLRLYDKLKQKDLLEDTLVIFTSDHGEALGEKRNGGRFGHGHPLTPETVNVPIVFCGAGLPKGRSFDQILSGVDIVPTVLAALGVRRNTPTDGSEVWNSTCKQSRLLRSEVWQHVELEVLKLSKDVSVYSACSAWNDSGGFVFNKKSVIERTAGLAYDNLFRGYSPAWKANFTLKKGLQMAKLALGSTFAYGSPDFTVEEAERVVPSSLNDIQTGSTRTLSDDQKEHLKDMGYL